MLYNIFDMSFDKESHYDEFVREFRFILYTHKVKQLLYSVERQEVPSSRDEALSLNTVMVNVLYGKGYCTPQGT
jgi:hypothetical protein